MTRNQLDSLGMAPRGRSGHLKTPLVTPNKIIASFLKDAKYKIKQIIHSKVHPCAKVLAFAREDDYEDLIVGINGFKGGFHGCPGGFVEGVGAFGVGEG